MSKKLRRENGSAGARTEVPRRDGRKEADLANQHQRAQGYRIGRQSRISCWNWRRKAGGSQGGSPWRRADTFL